MKIDTHDIQAMPSAYRNGFVFSWQDRILRGIYPRAQQQIQELLDSGLIAELESKKLFPKTHVTDYSVDGCALVLEHERISPILRPENWSFEMHKAACLCLLEVNRIASEYGYSTVDSCGLNILFSKGEPKFVDPGSFIKTKTVGPGVVKGWRGLQEFLQAMYYPLILRARGWDPELIQLSNESTASMLNSLHRHPFWSRLFSPRVYSRLEQGYYAYKMIHQIPDETIRDYLKYTAFRRFGARCILFGKRRNLLPLTRVSFVRLASKIRRVRKKRSRSTWGNYHDKAEVTPRFSAIADMLKDLPDCKTVLEFGGNSGFFSKVLLEDGGFDQVICTDYDSNAIDKLYLELCETKEGRIVPALLNFRHGLMRKDYPPNEKEFHSDIVCCLALTHHLFLTQGLSTDFVFGRINEYAAKYVAIEFMPMGLYAPKYDDTLALPDWYTEEWFKAGFEKYFSVLSRTVLEKNRVLYIGQVKST